MLSQFEIHDFRPSQSCPMLNGKSRPRRGSVSPSKISKAYNYNVDVNELVKDAKFIEREFDQKSE